MTEPRLGTLVLCEALRPPVVLAKALATLDRICGGRLDVGLGAGWYEPEYDAIGLPFPPPGVRVRRLREATEIVAGLLGGEPLTFHGTYHQTRGAVLDPPALQVPRPLVFVGGKGDRVIRTAVESADGWNTCWVWTPDAYEERLHVVDAACGDAGRDPEQVWRSLGLYALVGEDERDLARRFERLRAGDTGRRPGRCHARAVAGGPTRRDRRAGARAAGGLGGARGRDPHRRAGAVPFQVGALDDVELLAAALKGSR